MSLYNGDWRGVRRLSVCLSVNFVQIASSRRQMAGSPPNFHKMDSRLRSACIQGVLKVKRHVIRALSWILGMSYSVIDRLVKEHERMQAQRACSNKQYTMIEYKRCLGSVVVRASDS